MRAYFGRFFFDKCSYMLRQRCKPFIILGLCDFGIRKLLLQALFLQGNKFINKGLDLDIFAAAISARD